MKREYRRTNKRLRNLRHMTFQFREVNQAGDTFRDHFRHDKAQITLVRQTHQYDNGDVFVNWYCVELGGGNAGIGYWLRLAERRMRPVK